MVLAGCAGGSVERILAKAYPTTEGHIAEEQVPQTDRSDSMVKVGEISMVVTTNSERMVSLSVNLLGVLPIRETYSSHRLTKSDPLRIDIEMSAVRPGYVLRTIRGEALLVDGNRIRMSKQEVTVGRCGFAARHTMSVGELDWQIPVSPSPVDQIDKAYVPLCISLIFPEFISPERLTGLDLGLLAYPDGSSNEIDFSFRPAQLSRRNLP